MLIPFALVFERKLNLLIEKNSNLFKLLYRHILHVDMIPYILYLAPVQFQLVVTLCDVCEGGSNYFVSCRPLFVAFHVPLGCINVTQGSVWGCTQLGQSFEVERLDTLVGTCTLVTSLHLCFSCHVCYDAICFGLFAD